MIQYFKLLVIMALLGVFVAPNPTLSQDVCNGFGPQSPRDISNPDGQNLQAFSFAPPVSKMNLCNIHAHTNAEHKGPGYSMLVGDGKHGGFKCNDTDKLSASELEHPADGQIGFEGVKPGDTFEVHWVYSTCDVTPGHSLRACSNAKCQNPELRVESQVFLVVNDPDALDFSDFAYGGFKKNGKHQARSLPSETGTPVLYKGSTTGPSYTQSACSGSQVTWSVRPNCSKIDINSVNKWARDGNVFKENHAHGIRKLVTAPKLLSPIVSASAPVSRPLRKTAVKISGTISVFADSCHVDGAGSQQSHKYGSCTVKINNAFIDKPKCTFSSVHNDRINGKVIPAADGKTWDQLEVEGFNMWNSAKAGSFAVRFDCTGNQLK
ncbi:MAG: delta-class carbonic anhydrase [Sulfitobacter sp.]